MRDTLRNIWGIYRAGETVSASTFGQEYSKDQHEKEPNISAKMYSRIAILALALAICHAEPQYGHGGYGAINSYSNIGGIRGGYGGNIGGYGGLSGGYGGNIGGYGRNIGGYGGNIGGYGGNIGGYGGNIGGYGRNIGGYGGNIAGYGGNIGVYGRNIGGYGGNIGGYGGNIGGYGRNIGGYGGNIGGYGGLSGGYGGVVRTAAYAPVATVAAYPKIAVAPVAKVAAVQVEQYAPPHYSYEYAVNDQHTGDIKEQHEQREGDVTRGYYSLHEPDGTVRTVHYSVDGHSGFQATVEKSGQAVHPQAVKVAHAIPVTHAIAGPSYGYAGSYKGY